jgi:urease accessory protein
MIEGNALPLLVWLSPSFPVGAFAYSHALEWAVEAGDVSDLESCKTWIADLLEYGSGRTDSILLAQAWQAAIRKDESALQELAELTLALQPSAERYLETVTQGNAFITASNASWTSESLAFLRQYVKGDIAYPIAVGVAAAGFKIPVETTLESFLLAFVINLVSSVIRLGPLGQTNGQKVIAHSLQMVRRVAQEAAHANIGDIGNSAFRSDIASLRHETQYTRLFRS